MNYSSPLDERAPFAGLKRGSGYSLYLQRAEAARLMMTVCNTETRLLWIIVNTNTNQARVDACFF